LFFIFSFAKEGTQGDLASPLATPGLKSTQFLLALDMKIIEKYQNSSPSHGEDILVFYHTTNKLLYMTWGCLCVAWWGIFSQTYLLLAGPSRGSLRGTFGLSQL
jgi:hypothetical protein